MDKVYGFADRAWQFGVGCDPRQRCAPNCWARKTVARIVQCQAAANPDRAAFFARALSPNFRCWSGGVYLDPEHLTDPLKWRKPALIAGGFHCDWARLTDGADIDAIFAVAAIANQHGYLLLTKRPDLALSYQLHRATTAASWKAAARKLGYSLEFDSPLNGARVSLVPYPLPNVSLGVSIMDQADADKHLPAMKALVALGWRTHVWHEPAIGPVDWTGWEFIELLVVGGENTDRPFDIAWARKSIEWGRGAKVAVFIKQLGAYSVIAACRQNHYDFGDEIGRKARFSPVDALHPSTGLWRVHFADRKGSDPDEWPLDLRVRELPKTLTVPRG